MTPPTGVWRNERFADAVEQDKLQTLSDLIDDAAGYSDAAHATVAYSESPRGAAAAMLDHKQRAMLRTLLSTYLDRVPPEVSPLPGTTMTPSSTRCTSPGPAPSSRRAALLRVQGPQLLLEWDNTQRGANHAHSVRRDPTADFGLDVLAGHGPHH